MTEGGSFFVDILNFFLCSAVFFVIGFCRWLLRALFFCLIWGCYETVCKFLKKLRRRNYLHFKGAVSFSPDSRFRDALFLFFNWAELLVNWDVLKYFQPMFFLLTPFLKKEEEEDKPGKSQPADNLKKRNFSWLVMSRFKTILRTCVVEICHSF